MADKRALIVGLSSGDELEAPLQRAMPGGRPRMPVPIIGRPVVPPRPTPIMRYRVVDVGQLGESYERLASMVLARKMSEGDELGPKERIDLLASAGVPEELYGCELTSMVFTASADELGKGGVIGSISNAVSGAAKAVGGAAQSVADATIKPIAQKTAEIAKIAAPLAQNIPVIGPAVGTALNVTGAQIDVLSRSSAGSVLRNPAGTLGQILGRAGGAAASLIGAGGEGLGQLPGYAGNAANYLYQGGQSLIMGGQKILGDFSDSFVKGLEANNPGLSGKLTALFQKVPGEYGKFTNVFDGWSAALKDQPAGKWLGKVGGNFYTMAKDAVGNFSLEKHDYTQVPDSIGNQISEGGIAPSDASLYAQPGQLAGGGYGPAGAGWDGMPMNPAGLSLPAGPNGAGIITDNTTMKMLAAAVRDSLSESAAVEKKKSESGLSTMATPLMLTAAAGLALALVMSSRGGGQLMPRAIANGPRRARRRSRPRRRSRR